MRALVQRVKQAEVTVSGVPVGSIASGLLVFVGMGHDDTELDVRYIVNKIVNLRIFSDGDNNFHISALESGSEILVVSQFTLYATTRKGRRPSFAQAAVPEQAEIIFDRVVEEFANSGLKVASGNFREYMEVSLVNDGPVTFWLDSVDRTLPRD